MNAVWKDLPENIELKDPKNPLSAVSKGIEEHVYKYSFHPKSGRLLYCYPGQFHVDAINKAGDEDIFDEYVRIIYDHSNNVAGSRVWGESSFYIRNLEVDTKSFEVQYKVYRFFKQIDSSLKWILNLTNSDVTGDEREELDLSLVSKERILADDQIEELKQGFKMIYEDKKLSGYWGMGKLKCQ